MSFFEELSQKATQAGAKALEMTKGFSDAAILKSTVTSEEKKIQNYYSQIGRLYFHMYEDDYEDAFSEMIEGIRDSQKKIQECKEAIMKIKDIHYCEKCGAEVPNNSLYCSACHTPVPGAAPGMSANRGTGTVNCPHCGSQVEQGMKFCTSCGASVAAPNPESHRCPQCGAAIDGTLAFCTQCGMKQKS